MKGAARQLGYSSLKSIPQGMMSMQRYQREFVPPADFNTQLTTRVLHSHC